MTQGRPNNRAYDHLNNRAYGIFLKNSRNNLRWSQLQLALECHICRETLVDIERGRSYPNRNFRELFAQNLNNPVLEYYPPYSIGQFSERLQVRFQHEREAARYFLNGLQSTDLEGLKEVYSLYQKASERKDFTLMIVLDEYLHTRIMNAHPDRAIKDLVERYRQDYIEFFKVWISKLSIDITIGQVTTHFEIFEAIFEQNQQQLIEAIDIHLLNSLKDVEQIIQLLEPTLKKLTIALTSSPTPLKSP
jgi:transcriptional regulator with XRE-family HTH domain